MRICYNVQSHNNPDQIAKLVRTLTTCDPAGFVYLSHDRNGSEVPAGVSADPRVHVSLDEGGRGRFHNIQRWLDAASWLQAHHPVDFVVTLTAADYPLRPLGEFHDALTNSGDGMMEYFPVLSPGGNWPVHEGRSRYLYSWHDIAPLASATKSRLRPLLAVNRLQPLLRLNVAYDGLRVGIRHQNPFSEKFQCWGGSFFTNLSWRSVEHVLKVADSEPAVMAWARASLLIEEAFFQTILVSAGTFQFENTSGRYYDFRNSRHGSPATLGTRDVPVALASGAFFGRKWDARVSPEAIAALDAALGVAS